MTTPETNPDSTPDPGAGISWSEQAGVATITIDRADMRNSLNRPSVIALIEAFEKTVDARCVVLRSTGKSFCSGGDLPHLEKIASTPDEIRGSIEGSFQRLMRTIREHPAPVIARVQGPAVGAGADLALNCDLRVASSDAWIRESWIDLGVISALGASVNLSAAGGPGFALDVLLSGRKVGAEESAARGLFQRVVAPDELDGEVQALAGRIAGLDGDGVRAMKQLVRLVHDDGFDAALRAGLDHQERLMRAPEFAVRVRTILNSITKRTAG